MVVNHKESFRIIINSADLLRGSISDGFFQISVQKTKLLDPNMQWQFDIENFITNTNVAFAQTVSAIVINIPTLLQLNSYNTHTSSSSFQMLMLTTNSFSKSIQHNTIGHLLPSIEFLNRGVLELSFTDITGASLGNGLGAWSLSLLVWEVPIIKS